MENKSAKTKIECIICAFDIMKKNRHVIAFKIFSIKKEDGSETFYFEILFSESNNFFNQIKIKRVKVYD